MSDHARYEAEIIRLQGVVESLTRSGIDNAQRFADDLAAARGVTARLRAALQEGATDAMQAEALAEAIHVVETHPPLWRMTIAARAYIALSESHATTRALLRATLDGVDAVTAAARGGA